MVFVCIGISNLGSRGATVLMRMNEESQVMGTGEKVSHLKGTPVMQLWANVWDTVATPF